MSGKFVLSRSRAQTPIGVLPTDWEVKQLGEHAHIKARIGWRGLSADEYMTNGPLLVAGTHIRGTQIDWSSCDHISDFRYEESPEIQLQDRDVILSKDGTLGRIGLVEHLPGRATINGTMMLVRPDHCVFKPKFLYYYLQGRNFRNFISEKVSGSSVPHIFQRDIVRLLAPSPPLPEQRKIAAILTSVDDAVENSQAVINQVQVVKRGLMQELLTRGLPGRHMQLKRTDIGEIPDEWQVVELASVASIERGKFAHRPRNDPRFYGGRYPFIQTGDVAACDGLITTFSQTLNEEGLTVSKLFPAGTIVITIAANIGSTGIATFDVAFPDSLIGIQAGPRIDTRFLELILRTRKRDLNRFAPESAQKNINLDTLKPLKVPLPRMAEQRRIAELLWSIIRREQNANLYRDGLTRIKSALMSVLLTGELRVSPDTEAA